MRYFGFLLIVGLVVGCHTTAGTQNPIPREPGVLVDTTPPELECENTPWPDVDGPDVSGKSATQLLDAIKLWADPGSQLDMDAESRKTKLFVHKWTSSLGTPYQVTYTREQAWARVAIAYRYAQLAEENRTSNPALRLQYLDLALEVIKITPDEFDSGWAEISLTTEHQARYYLEQTSGAANDVPGAPEPYRTKITESVNSLLCSHALIDKLDPTKTIKLDDQVAWGYALLAYYASHEPFWDLCASEVNHIEQ